MTTLKLQYIHRFKDRHGKVRHYFRRSGFPSAKLPGAPGSAEFMRAYEAAMGRKPPPVGASRTIPGSMSELIVAYYGSAAFTRLAPATRATYRNLIEEFRERYGRGDYRTMRATFVRRYIAEKADVHAPAAANARLKMLRILMGFARETGRRTDDPTDGVRRVRSASEGIHCWSEAEISAYRARWEIGTRERLALELLLGTGQRKSDVIKFGRQHIQADAIVLRQQKTGTPLELPISDELKAVLDALPPGQLAFLVTSAGAPFTPGGFGNWFGESARAAGLPAGCTAHGLRKACARRLADAGCSAREIMAVTGHKTMSEATRYTAAADQRHLARQAFGRPRVRA